MRSGKVVVVALLLLSALAVAVIHLGQRGGRAFRARLLLAQAGGIRQYKPLSNVPMNLNAQAVRILLGLRDVEPTVWSGSLKLSKGKLLSVEPWRAGAGDVVNPDGTFKLQTKRFLAGAAKKEVMTENGLVIVLEGSPETQIEVATDKGNFSFSLGDLSYGKHLRFLDGQAQAELVPCPIQLADTEREEDYPAMASQDNIVALAYVEHDHLGPPTAIDIKSLPADEQGIPTDYSAFRPTDGGDRVMLTIFNGEEWEKPQPVTDEGLDVWRPAVAIDGRGVVWVVWSQNMNGNWELLCRRFDLKKRAWSQIERLTNDVELT
jgi:hypothetical protein